MKPQETTVLAWHFVNFHYAYYSNRQEKRTRYKSFTRENTYEKYFRDYTSHL